MRGGKPQKENGEGVRYLIDSLTDFQGLLREGSMMCAANARYSITEHTHRGAEEAEEQEVHVGHICWPVILRLP